MSGRRVALGVPFALVVSLVSVAAGASAGASAGSPAATDYVESAASPAPSKVASSTRFLPETVGDLDALTALVLLHAPSLQTDLAAVDQARGDHEQSKLLLNPTVDATWGTIPIGERNPSNLDSPLLNVPNYSIGVSYTFLIGKRGPRQERAAHLVTVARAQAHVSARTAAVNLARVIGVLAATALRDEGLRAEVEDARASVELAKSRMDTGFGTPLELDRMEIELARLEQQVLANEVDGRAALAACAAALGVQCTPITGREHAQNYLAGWVARALASTTPVENRPDIRALDATRAVAVAEADIASAQAIPDPTVRVGYMHDRFVASGNQQNSLSLSVSVPIPIFDRGQAQRRAAEAKRNRATLQRSMLLQTASARATALRELLQLQQKRRESVSAGLPKARAVLADLQRAVNSRLLPMTEVINVRRLVSELLLQEADAESDAYNAAVDLLSELGTKENLP